MATVGTPLGGFGPSTPKLSGHAKVTQIKPAQTQPSSPPPLKFRSFDAFYQYYSKKQSSENAVHRAPHITQPVHDTALAPKESPQNTQKIGPESPKPSVTCTTEDYNIQGRVKRLCEIFQRAHDNSTYRARLQKVISKKAAKAERTQAPKADLPLTRAVAPPNTAATLKPKNKPDAEPRVQVDAGNSPLIDFVDSAPLESCRASLQTSEAPSDAEFGPASFQDSLESPYLAAVPPDIFEFDRQPNIVSRRTARGLDADDDAQVDFATAEREAMIDGILSRFINDPEFCDSFFNKLECLNLSSRANSAKLSRIVDELQFLVDAEGPNAVSRMNSDENRKLFDWFFNQPKVFDFDDGERSEAAEHGSPAAFHADPLTERLGLSEPSSPRSERGGPGLPDLGGDDEDDFNSHLAGQFDWFTKQR